MDANPARWTDMPAVAGGSSGPLCERSPAAALARYASSRRRTLSVGHAEFDDELDPHRGRFTVDDGRLEFELAHRVERGVLEAHRSHQIQRGRLRDHPELIDQQFH